MTADYEVRPLSATDREEVAAMTFPSYRHLLDLRQQPRHPDLGEIKPVQPFGFVARRSGTTVGLALAERPVAGEADEPQLLSVFVATPARRRGIARALVAAVEEEARDRGFTELSTIYTTGKAGIEWMDRIFDQRGWQPPAPGSVSVRFRPANALASPAFEPRHLRLYSRGLEIFPWSELTAEEERRMRESNAARRWIEPALEPWQFDPAALDDSSVGARYRGREVVGWVLNHSVAPGLVRFSISFMRRDLSRAGRILSLYHASLRIVEKRGSCRYCTFITPASYPRMVAFVDRWITPFATFIGESRRRCLALAPERA